MHHVKCNEECNEMSIVILAEKPSQALAYAGAFQRSVKKDGYFAITDDLFQEETFITFGFGHLVELAPPGHYEDKWGKWNLANLPIFPAKYEFVVPKDKKKQFKIVADLLKAATTIIVATDSDREGENIAWSIIIKANAYKKNKTYKRLWINSLEKESIRDGFEHLKEGLDYIPYYQEARARQISDWLIGMNGSPLYSLALQKKGIQGVFSLGRVQTPTLYLIYKRQLEIENFKKTPYFEVESDIKSSGGIFKGSLSPAKKFKDNEEVMSFLAKNQAVVGVQDGQIANVEKRDKKTNSPMLYSLSSLQSKVNQLYKASASNTLKAVQSLYEAKLLTYPRTDTPYITNNEFNYLKEKLPTYKAFLGIDYDTPQTQPRKRYVDDKKVQEHHAIILTKQVPSKERFSKLPSLQQQIYMLIAKTTVAMFLPDYQYLETVIDTKVAEILFKSKGQVPIVQGWKQLFSKEDKKEKTVLLPNVTVGEKILANIRLVEKETQPPKPFTEGTLITAMKTAGKTVDDEKAQEMLKEIEGIGTEATRASIIETIKNRDYIEAQKNNLFVTEKGKVLCLAIESEPLLASAEMTAKWETYLKKIGRKEGDAEIFLANIQKFINHLIEAVPSQIESVDFSAFEVKEEFKSKYASKRTAVGKCPKCGGSMVSKGEFYGCGSYPNCKHTLSDNFRKKKLTKKNIKELLEGKETQVTGIKKTDTSTYNAIVKVNEKGYIDLVSVSNDIAPAT